MKNEKPILEAPTLDPNAEETTLVVVDMQEGLGAAQDEKVIAAVKRLIGLAIEKQWGIVFLEYKDPAYGKTHGELLELVLGYDKWHLEEKPDKDGSEFVQQTCQSKGYATNRFVVCGVNLDACVVWTCNGLARLFRSSKIEVVHQASHSENPYMWDTWRSFVAHDSIVIVSHPD